MDFTKFTDGELIDRIDSIRESGRGNPAEITAIQNELEARMDSGPREHRNGPGASDADMTEIAGYRGSAKQATPENRAFTAYLRNGTMAPELRALGEDSGAAGGYTVPQSFWNRMAIALKAYGGLSANYQQLATDDGRPMPFPTNDPTAVEASYIDENTQVGLQDYVFGQGMLFGWTLTTGAILVSRPLIQDSATDVDQFVADRIGESIGRKLAAEAMNGLGAGSRAATGIVPSLVAYGSTTDNASGGVYDLGTATPVKLFSGDSTELEGNVLAPQTCVNIVASVDSAYWPSCAWYMSPQQAMNMHAVVDDNGRSLLNLENAFADGAIGNLLGFPVRIVPECAALSASTAGGPIFGAMDHAMVMRLVSGASTMRLTERYADFNQVGFIGWQRFDIQPMDLRAAVVVKPAAS